jgi:hypothetical protein
VLRIASVVRIVVSAREKGRFVGSKMSPVMLILRMATEILLVVTA